MPSEIKIDLHDIFNSREKIDRALNDAFSEAQRLHAKRLQVVHGKGSGQLKRLVQRFVQESLRDPAIKAAVRKVENDSKNWGRLFVHFRWNP